MTGTHTPPHGQRQNFAVLWGTAGRGSNESCPQPWRVPCWLVRYINKQDRIKINYGDHFLTELSIKMKICICENRSKHGEPPLCCLQCWLARCKNNSQNFFSNIFQNVLFLRNHSYHPGFGLFPITIFVACTRESNQLFPTSFLFHTMNYYFFYCSSLYSKKSCWWTFAAAKFRLERFTKYSFGSFSIRTWLQKELIPSSGAGVSLATRWPESQGDVLLPPQNDDPVQRWAPRQQQRMP